MIRVCPYTADHIHEVEAFNRRLGETHGEFQFPESPIPGWLPRHDAVPLYQEFFVAREDQSAVRGGYILKPQAFALNGHQEMIAGVRMTVSEGAVNPRYAMVGLKLIKDALARQPLLFGLGMGGFHRPIARLFQSLRCRLIACPFFFRVVHPGRFLRQIVPLRESFRCRCAADVLAWSGLGWCGITALQLARRIHQPSLTSVAADVVQNFGDWSNAIWGAARDCYSLMAVRNQVILNTLYPESQARFIRLRVTRFGDPIGWAVLLDTPMKQHRYFANLRVGSIVDCLARPGSEATVIAAATRYLVQRGVDLIVSNQLHEDWCAAFAHVGYLTAASNFLFAASPVLTARLGESDPDFQRIHMTRGDGDGPINL